MTRYEPVDLGHPDANTAVNWERARLDDSPPAWWYISFVDETGFLGACFVEATNQPMACVEARRRGCNPGGQAAIWGPLDEADAPDDHRNRLLSREEVEGG